MRSLVRRSAALGVVLLALVAVVAIIVTREGVAADEVRPIVLVEPDPSEGERSGVQGKGRREATQERGGSPDRDDRDEDGATGSIADDASERDDGEGEAGSDGDGDVGDG